MRQLKPATPKVLAIDGFCWKRYNADPDGERESTVPIILTVGKVARAFPTGSVRVAYAANNSPSTRKPLCNHLRIYKG